MISTGEQPTMSCAGDGGDGGTSNQGGKSGLGPKKPIRRDPGGSPSAAPETDGGTAGKKPKTGLGGKRPKK